jgi:hypothetical protein
MGLQPPSTPHSHNPSVAACLGQLHSVSPLHTCCIVGFARGGLIATRSPSYCSARLVGFGVERGLPEEPSWILLNLPPRILGHLSAGEPRPGSTRIVDIADAG